MEKDLIIKGMTEEQIISFLEWYSVQGEKIASDWFELRDIPTPMTDNKKKIEHGDGKIIAHFRESKEDTL